MSTKDRHRALPMSYLCIVKQKQTLALTFADSPSQRVHTPGNNTCRLRRQQKVKIINQTANALFRSSSPWGG